MTNYISLYSPKKIACLCAILIGFSIPVSTGLDTILLILLLIFSLMSWNTQYLKIISQNPVTKSALLLFGVLLIACFYGKASTQASLKILTKYDDLILFAILLPIFSEKKMRIYGQYAFMSAMALTLILSYLIWLGALQQTSAFSSRLPENPVVFKLHITHSILMGFFAYMLTVYAIHNNRHKWRWSLLVVAILAACNVLFMTQGRTGYIAIMALIIYLFFTLLKLRHLLLGIGLIIILLVGVSSTPKIQSRIVSAVHEMQIWQPMQGNNEASSIGTRMDYYTNTAKIIYKNPIIGVGTGGFEAAYAKEIKGSTIAPSNNPHNQFLLFWAQTGIVGLSAFLLLLWVSWRAAERLPSKAEAMLAHGVLITIIAASLFNSSLLDHAEGLFFAWFCGLLFAGLPQQQT